jgi:hypothetical protein
MDSSIVDALTAFGKGQGAILFVENCFSIVSK